jgi:hypothetical protein
VVFVLGAVGIFFGPAAFEEKYRQGVRILANGADLYTLLIDRLLNTLIGAAPGLCLEKIQALLYGILPRIAEGIRIVALLIGSLP